MIWVEVKSDQPKIDKGNNQSNETKAANLTLGTFQAYDAQAKIVEVCSPSVDNATAHPKTEVQVSSSTHSNFTPKFIVGLLKKSSSLT